MTMPENIAAQEIMPVNVEMRGVFYLIFTACSIIILCNMRKRRAKDD